MRLKLWFVVLLLLPLAACQQEKKVEENTRDSAPQVQHEVIQPKPVLESKVGTMVETTIEKTSTSEVSPVAKPTLERVKEHKTQALNKPAPEAITHEKAKEEVAVAIKTKPKAKVVVKEIKKPQVAAVMKKDKPVTPKLKDTMQQNKPIIPKPKAIVQPKVIVVALGDAALGKKMAKKCQACHTFGQGGKNKTGPNLFGVFGRKQGSVAKFKYGSYLKTAGGVWTESNLRAWIENSKGVAKAAGKKTKMPPQKIKTNKADNLLAYLKTLK